MGSLVAQKGIRLADAVLELQQTVFTVAEEGRVSGEIGNIFI